MITPRCAAFPVATVLIGDFAGSLDQVQSLPGTPFARFAAALRAAKRKWLASEDKEPDRTIMRNLPAFAQAT
jgi:hypothetical protein